MVQAGIDNGDLLVVNRALTPEHRHIVKYLHKENGRVKLVAANPTFTDIVFKVREEDYRTGRAGLV